MKYSEFLTVLKADIEKKAEEVRTASGVNMTMLSHWGQLALSVDTIERLLNLIRNGVLEDKEVG